MADVKADGFFSGSVEAYTTRAWQEAAQRMPWLRDIEPDVYAGLIENAFRAGYLARWHEEMLQRMTPA